MTQRERLIELIRESLMENIGKSCNLAEIIADHLLANGVIVPPCKVGDKVYYTERNTLQEMRVEYGTLQNGFTMTAKCLDKCDMCTIFCDPKKKACGVVFDYNVIGKTVFLTREEAEKALERSKQ